ncbi:MAG: hypothetical protein IKV25_04545 [Clostridia bacterium]|nr:hypothetical protein [Clostridia bacterium]
MKRILISVVFVIICLSLAVAFFNISSFESLLRPPRLSGDNSLLQHAFEKTVSNSDGIIMKNPLAGEHTSTYLFFDINNDGQEEAFVFYSDLSEDNLACVSIFKKVKNNWSFVSKIKSRSDEIYEVNFADINGDENYEILLSSKNTDDIQLVSNSDFTSFGNKLLSVYSFGDASTTLLKTEIYSSLNICDLNNDNADDLFLLNINLSDLEKKTTGRILSFREDYSVQQDISVLLTGMLDVYNMVTDTYVSNDVIHTRLYIDGAISERGVITEVLDVSHDDFQVTLPLYENNQSSQPTTLRDAKSISRDFDGDNIIEIPTFEIFPYAENILKGSSDRNSFNITVWNELDGKNILTDKKCVQNSSYKYFLIIDDAWLNEISFIYDSNNQTMTFYYIDSNGTFDKEIFSIRTFSSPEWSKSDSGYSQIKETSSYVYAVKYNNEDEETKFEDYIEQSFHVYS